jgi:hypothetical protein
METAKNKWCYKNPHAVCVVAFTSQSAVKGAHNHSAHVCNARSASSYIKLLLRQFFRELPEKNM